jgi:hypothetical protein
LRDRNEQQKIKQKQMALPSIHQITRNLSFDLNLDKETTIQLYSPLLSVRYNSEQKEQFIHALNRTLSLTNTIIISFQTWNGNLDIVELYYRNSDFYIYFPMADYAIHKVTKEKFLSHHPQYLDLARQFDQLKEAAKKYASPPLSLQQQQLIPTIKNRIKQNVFKKIEESCNDMHKYIMNKSMMSIGICGPHDVKENTWLMVAPLLKDGVRLIFVMLFKGWNDGKSTYNYPGPTLLIYHPKILPFNQVNVNIVCMAWNEFTPYITKAELNLDQDVNLRSLGDLICE